MEQMFGFTKMTIAEFESWLSNLPIARTVLKIQQHHTFSPSYIHCKDDNHFAVQKGMKNYHVAHNGWSDIGQHFTSFPDGSIVTGRSLEQTPACIYGNNANSVCIENLGNFDKGGDKMTDSQQQTILRMSAALCKKFHLIPTTETILYHHWFNLSTGERNNGSKNNKTCPGTNFFGGNTVSDCEQHFLPLLRAFFDTPTRAGGSGVIRYVCVDSATLNIRSGPGTTNTVLSDSSPLQIGAVLRVYKEENGWLKISESTDRWVSGKFATEVKRKTVNAPTLNFRSGPSTDFPVLGSFLEGQEIFISREENGWSKVNKDNRWVKTSYLA